MQSPPDKVSAKGVEMKHLFAAKGARTIVDQCAFVAVDERFVFYGGADERAAVCELCAVGYGGVSAVASAVLYGCFGGWRVAGWWREVGA